MRRLGLILALLCSILLSSCGGSVKDISVTSFKLVSVSPQGTSGVSILVEVGLNNPGMGFEVTDLQAVFNIDKNPALMVSADQLMVEGRKEKIYSIPLKGRIADGANPFQLLRLLNTDNVSNFLTADFSARVALRGGIGKKIEIKDIQLNEFLKQNRAQQDE